MMSVRRMRVHVRFRQNDFHFRHRDHRQEPDEQQKQRGENSERANERPDIDPGWNKNTPRGRDEIAMESTDNDDETLEPHAGVHTHANKVDDENVSPAPAEPEKLRRKNIAKQHAGPPIPQVRTEDAVPKRAPLVSVAATPGHEKFNHAGITD